MAAYEVLDYETAGHPELSVVSSGLTLRSGDHVHWRHLGAWRDGIVQSVSTGDKNTADVTVLRYCCDFPRMVVSEEVCQLNFDKDLVKRYEYGQYCHPPRVVLKRATSCVGYSGYNAIRNNNEDFCRWCKSAKHTYMLRNDFQLAGLTDKDDSEMTDWLTVLSWEDTVHGDHIAWRTGRKPCQHGIVTRLDNHSADIATSDGEKCSITRLAEDQNIEVFRVLYRKCHSTNFVIQRAQEFCDSPLRVEDTYTFAKWCKTGVPANSRVSEVRHSQSLDMADLRRLQKEALGTSSRAGTTSAARGMATVVAQQTGSSVASVLVEGTTAVAAVGVEALVAGLEVGLTYKSFRKKQISKDELNKRNIITVTRSTGAAGCSIAGGVAGAAVGSALPVIGTVVGGIVGGIIGGVSGQVVGHFSGKGIAHAASRPYEYNFVEFELEQVI